MKNLIIYYVFMIPVSLMLGFIGYVGIKSFLLSGHFYKTWYEVPDSIKATAVLSITIFILVVMASIFLLLVPFLYPKE